jgi:hypothetical protein
MRCQLRKRAIEAFLKHRQRRLAASLFSANGRYGMSEIHAFTASPGHHGLIDVFAIGDPGDDDSGTAVCRPGRPRAGEPVMARGRLPPHRASPAPPELRRSPVHAQSGQ